MATTAATLLRKLSARQCSSLRLPFTPKIASPSIGCVTQALNVNATMLPSAYNTPATAAMNHRPFTSSPITLDNATDESAPSSTTAEQKEEATAAASNSVEIPDASFHHYTEDVTTMSYAALTDPTTIPGFTTLIHSPPSKVSTPRNALVGKVVSDKMQKTVNVAVDRYKIVPKYRKRLKYTRKFMAHDEEEECREGDLVMIVPCRRMSKRKHFRVHEILRAKGVLQ